VNDPLRVRGRESFCDGDRNLDRLLPWGHRTREPAPKGLALEQLHDRVRGTTVVPEIVNCQDVGVVERRNSFGFTLEAGNSISIAYEMLRKNLDRHVSLEAPMPRAIHFAHTASTEGRQDFVRPELRARK